MTVPTLTRPELGMQQTVTAEETAAEQPTSTEPAAAAEAGAPSRARSPLRAALSTVGTAISFIALVVGLLAAAVLVVVPMATGSQTYTVLTNSMAPSYPPGTFLVVRPLPFEEIERGDVITYQLQSGQPEVITHRVISTTAGQQGEGLLITQGDNNALPDPEPVRPAQVRGELFYAVPFVGFLANALGNADRSLFSLVVASGLLLYGVAHLSAAALSGLRSRKASSDD